MPLDPSIILQTTNINAEAAKQAQAQTQTQEAQNQLKLGQYAVLQAKQDFEDTQNMKQAWRAAQGDPAQALAIASRLGVSPKTMQAFQMQQMALQEKLDNHNKIVADTGKTNLDVMNEKNEQLYTKVAPLINAKSDVEFQAKKPQILQAVKDSGLASDDDILMLTKANQQDVQDWATGHLNVKALTDIVKANAAQQGADAKTSEADTAAKKQANESASQIETSNQAKLNGISTELQNALRAGGANGYQKALDKYANDPLVTGSFLSGDKIAGMTPAQAKQSIDFGGMTAQQRQEANDRQQQMQQTADYQQKEIKLRQQSTEIQRQMLGLDVAKTQAALFSAGLGADGKPLADNDKTLLTPNLQNTSDGRNFIDQDTAFKGLPKGQQLQLKQSAAAAGIPMLSAKDAGAVKSVDTARNTINDVFATFMKSAGAGTTGIIGHVTGIQSIRNWAAANSGVNPDLDAAKKNFLVSIETMKSAGGQGSGLRITGAEITQIGKLMPTFGDTQEQLHSKLSQINTLVNGNLNSALHNVPVVTNRDGTPKTSGPSGGVVVTAPDGTVLSFPNQTAANAFKKEHGLQ